MEVDGFETERFNGEEASGFSQRSNVGLPEVEVVRHIDFRITFSLSILEHILIFLDLSLSFFDVSVSLSVGVVDILVSECDFLMDDVISLLDTGEMAEVSE